MRGLFMWQLIGDVFKLAAWLLGYLMLAKAMTQAFILTEVFFSAFFVGLTFWFVNNFGLIGVTYAHAVNYAVLLVVVFFITRSKFA
jgi:PST family polysaccharide transporter